MPSITTQRAWNEDNPHAAMWCRLNPDTQWGRTYVSDGCLPTGSTYDLIQMISQDLISSPTAPARGWEALSVPNGDYAVGHNRDTHNFRIHLVSSGALAGQRIIKVNRDGVYRGFGFITREGGFSLWARFQRDANEPYVAAAMQLIEYLHWLNEMDVTSGVIALDNYVAGNLPFHSTADNGDRITIQPRPRCAQCNNLSSDRGSFDAVALCATHIFQPIPEPAPSLRTHGTTMTSGNAANVTVTGMTINAPTYDDGVHRPAVAPPLLCELGTGEVR